MRDKWHPTNAHAQLGQLVPQGASFTCFLDKQTPILWGTRTYNTKHLPFSTFSYKKEREQYWDGTTSQWDSHTRFFRFKKRIQIDKKGKW